MGWDTEADNFEIRAVGKQWGADICAQSRVLTDDGWRNERPDS